MSRVQKIVMVLSVAVIISFVFAVMLIPPRDTTDISDQEACPKDFHPVCGMNGTTYDNACLAAQHHSKIVSVGACPVPSLLADNERKYLFWLLKARETANQDTVPVKHIRTIDGNCADCYSFYYSWGNPAAVARLTVVDDTVTEALSTDGYDYLHSTSTDTIGFPELRSNF